MQVNPKIMSHLLRITSKNKHYKNNHRITDFVSGKYFIRPSTVSIVEEPILCLLLIPSKCYNYTVNIVHNSYICAYTVNGQKLLKFINHLRQKRLSKNNF